MSTALKPCGTPAAYKRHKRRGEPACDPCRDANREESSRQRKQPTQPRSESTTPHLIAEIRFLINAGEGEHRILQATGYEGRAKSLRCRLTKAGHHNLAQAVFNTWELAA